MGLADELSGKRVALDAAPLIYFIERRQPYLDQLRPFFRLVENGQASIVTSVVTLMEVLVHPIRAGDEALAKQYHDILRYSRNILTLPVSPEIAQIAAELRAESRLKPADALHLATAVREQADCFLTNDRDFGAPQPAPIIRLSHFDGSRPAP